MQNLSTDSWHHLQTETFFTSHHLHWCFKTAHVVQSRKIILLLQASWHQFFSHCNFLTLTHPGWNQQIQIHSGVNPVLSPIPLPPCYLVLFIHRMAEANIPCLKIALIAEQQSTYSQLGYSEDDCAALPHDGEIQAVSTSLQKLGHHVTLVPGIQSLVQHLATGQNKHWDLAFNMAQGFHGSARESQVPALLEAYRTPYTFADAATMALCQNKAISKVRTPAKPGSLSKTSIGWSLHETLDRSSPQ